MKVQLLERIASRKAVVGIVGLGYVGLPLCCASRGGLPGPRLRHRREEGGAAQRGPELHRAHRGLPGGGRAQGGLRGDRRLRARGRGRRAHHLRADAARPAPRARPLVHHRHHRVAAPHLRPGQLVFLETTTYPGTTDEVLPAPLEPRGFTAGGTSSWPSAPSARTRATPASRRRDHPQGRRRPRRRRAASSPSRSTAQAVDRSCRSQPRGRRGVQDPREHLPRASTSPWSTS